MMIIQSSPCKRNKKRQQLEEEHWIEGRHTPDLISTIVDTIPKLTDLDCEIIDYVKCKWSESGKAAEFTILLNDEWKENCMTIREFLRLWLYGKSYK
ncbi:MAG: hypothetical protein LBD23_04360 [Oscillospiraceae bacterium]|jgi:hypothetical protein|nr:hypothetical protein [Oscillospiraceae bacterium]